MRALVLAAGLWMLALPLWADARSTVLVDVLRLGELAEILQREGLENAETLDRDMLGGQGGAGWALQVRAIYNPERIVETLRGALDAGLQGQAREDVIAFFAQDTGARIITLENEARAAITDPEVEDAARAGFHDLEGSDDPRLAQIATLIDSGDMIDRNVTAAINSNFQFMRGMADGNALQMTEAEMLADVAQQQEEIAQDTRGWLYGYLLLAYSPLEDAELDRYIAFAQSDAGRGLNTALFEGFGTAYEDVSYALGRAVALNMVAEEL
ncbi:MULTISPECIES: hypothetical protein [unclassified Sulfitobacter]|uniref:hypothetical protein n=1 Tax=unclassified Sulfitobacter TaxID=196795 RepID=UPI0004E2BE58|nr:MULTISPECIES: hypothetical protein [unclassified Sulfitobacter]PTA99108.1 hypothetical protein C8254_11675 [Sulfitobacter sp. CB-A]ULO18773.1 hypothetical protein IV89_001743 [Sulfitobacter sp. CB2047]